MARTNARTNAFKDNLGAGVAPGVSNDDTEKYDIGSVWLDTTADKAYICFDNSTGAAQWILVSQDLTGALLAANDLSDVASASTARTNLGLEIGVDVQAWDADLDTYATKTPPTGDIVGTTDAQAFTNKTGNISQWTNDSGYLTAIPDDYVLTAGDTMTGQLEFSGTTHAGVKLLSLTTTERNALTPAEGMLIANETTNNAEYYDGTSWVDLTSAGGSGEVNTASNVGTLGTGIFKQKTGVDLELYKIASDNNLLTVALSGTDYLNLTVNEASIDHDALTNFVAGEHFLQSAITEVGTIATGVWNGTDIAVADGGTGASDAGTARTNLGVDAAGTDNSTDVTLAGTGTYISIAGQVITVDPITESDISDLGTYLTGNETITLSGDVTGSGATAITTTIAAGAVDLAMLSATGTPTGSNFLRGDNTWATPAGSGDVSGPGSSTDNALVRFDGATGNVIQNSVITISDTGEMSGVILDDFDNTIHADGIHTRVKNSSGAQLNKGDAVYISGYDGVSELPEVDLADADDASKMPAIGLMMSNTADGSTGGVTSFGDINSINTSSWAVGDAVYVDTTAGALTNVRPTGATSNVQKIAMVQRVDASNGVLLVMGAYRSNDVSNKISDAIFRLHDDGDATKLINFQLSGLTTATTRTLTIQDSDGTIALVGDDLSTFNNDSGFLTTVDISDDTNLVVNSGVKLVDDTVSIDILGLTQDASPDSSDRFMYQELATSSTKSISKFQLNGILSHDSLSGFVSNEHIDHSGVTLTAGEGLTGGGTIEANRNFALDFSDLSSTDTSVGATDLISIHDGSQKKITLANFETSLTITESQISDLGTYLTGNETITLTGDITGSGTTSFATTIAVDAVDIAMLSATGTADGTTFLRGDNVWATPDGGGDVSAAANITDNALVRGDGGVKGVQDSGIIIDDSDNITEVGNITGIAGGITISGGTASGGNLTINSTNHGTKGVINFDNELYIDQAHGTVSVGVNPTTLTNEEELNVGGTGRIMFEQATSPLAETGYGKIYMKSDGDLYFMNGGGTEYNIIDDLGGDADQNLWATLNGDSGSTTADSTTDTVTFVGGTDITTAVTDNTVTINYSGSGTAPAGSNYEIQYNASGSFGAENLFRYDYDTNTLVVGITTGEDTELTMDMFRDTTSVLGTTNNSGVVAGFSNALAGDAFIKTSANGVGDSGISFSLDDTTGWVIGVDNSDSDKLKFNPAFDSLTSAVALEMDSSGNAIFTGDVSVSDEAYGVGWDASVEVPTKNAVYDKIESLAVGGDPDQNIFLNVTADVGADLVADTTTDTLSILGGTGITTTNTSGTDTLTIDVDDDYLLNTGDVGTGAYDFGGATTFEIPNNSAPTMAANGQIAVDTNVSGFGMGLVKYYSGQEMGVIAIPVADLVSPGNQYAVVYDGSNNKFTLSAQTGAPDQNLWETIAGDTGSTAANITTDTLTVTGGTSITTAMSGDTLTITNDAPNVDQNLFETVASDSGSAVADTTTDTLTLTGGNAIDTSASGDTITIAAAAASTTVAGVAQLATTAEIDAGTGDLALSVNEFNHSIHGVKEMSIVVLDNGTAAEVGDEAGSFEFPIPDSLDGMDLVGIKGFVHDAGVTGTMDVQFRNITKSLDILSTKLKFATTSKTDDGNLVINASNNHVSAGDIMRFDIDAIHTGTAANGLSFTISYRKP